MRRTASRILSHRPDARRSGRGRGYSGCESGDWGVAERLFHRPKRRDAQL